MEYTNYILLSLLYVSGTPLGGQQLVSRLLSEPDSVQGLPTEYLNELVSRFVDDGLDMVNI